MNLKIAGYPEPRFQETLDFILQKKFEEAEDLKQTTFVNTLTTMLHQFDSLDNMHDQMRQLRIIYDFLVENIWFRDTFPSIDRMAEDKLIELARHEYFAHDALFYLSEMYGIYVRAEFDESSDDDMIEYILDTRQQKHYI